MREINIDELGGFYYPCEVRDFRFNPISRKYVLFYFNKASQEFYMTNVVAKNGQVMCEFPEVISDVSSLKLLGFPFFNEADMAILPEYLPNVDTLGKKEYFKGIEEVFTLDDDYLKVISYADALKEPVVGYYRIISMVLDEETINYELKYVGNILPKKGHVYKTHKTELALNDIRAFDEVINVKFPYNTDNVGKNMVMEKVLVEKLISLNNGKRSVMDSVLLTRIVRIMLAQEDVVSAVRDYESYLNLYYDPWILKKYRRNR